jgi:hypothetical protein
LIVAPLFASFIHAVAGPEKAWASPRRECHQAQNRSVRQRTQSPAASGQPAPENEIYFMYTRFFYFAIFVTGS